MTLVFEEMAARESDWRDEGWLLSKVEGDENTSPIALITIQRSRGGEPLPPINIDHAVCARDGCDPDWWFPTGSNDHDTAMQAISLCGACPERLPCKQRGRLELTGVWGGVWIGNPRPEGTKVCIDCRVSYPINKFKSWGTSGRYRKTCFDCDPRFSEEDEQPQPVVTR